MRVLVRYADTPDDLHVCRVDSLNFDSRRMCLWWLDVESGEYTEVSVDSACRARLALATLTDLGYLDLSAFTAQIPEEVPE